SVQYAAAVDDCVLVPVVVLAERAAVMADSGAQNRVGGAEFVVQVMAPAQQGHHRLRRPVVAIAAAGADLDDGEGGRVAVVQEGFGTGRYGGDLVDHSASRRPSLRNSQMPSRLSTTMCSAFFPSRYFRASSRLMSFISRPEKPISSVASQYSSYRTDTSSPFVPAFRLGAQDGDDDLLAQLQSVQVG